MLQHACLAPVRVSGALCSAFGHKGREAEQNGRERGFFSNCWLALFSTDCIPCAVHCRSTCSRFRPHVLTVLFLRLFLCLSQAAFSYRCAASSGAVRSLFRSPNLTLSVHSTGLLLSSTDGRRKRDQQVRRVLTIDGLNAALALVVTEH